MAVKISKNVKYLVRVRDYETAHVEVGAEISHHDISYDDDNWAVLSKRQRDELIETMHAMLNHEVDRIAREELEIIAGWSEISPNLALDFLSVEPPPATMQRKPHARKTTGADAAPTRGRAAAASA
jgi:hypothetical protein